MNELFGQIRGVVTWFKRLILNFLLIGLLIILLISNGWIKIVCDGRKIIKDINNSSSEIKDIIESKNHDSDYNVNKVEKVSSNPINYRIIDHVLERDQTIFDLQTIYGTDWHIIQKENEIKDINQLREGDVVKVPVKIELG